MGCSASARPQLGDGPSDPGEAIDRSRSNSSVANGREENESDSVSSEMNHVYLLGVRLRIFDEFVASFGGREHFRGLTITQVFNTFLNDLTCSYCSLLKSQGQDGVGRGNVYVSHAWDFEFLEVLDSLKHALTDNDQTFIWFDLFSVDWSSSSDPTINWCDILSSIIASVDKFVLVLAPWDDPLPLSRPHCLFELFLAAKIGLKIEFVSSKEGIDALNIALLIDRDVLRLFSPTLLRWTDTATDGQWCILHALRDFPNEDELNHTVQSRIDDWLMVTLTELMVAESRTEPKEKIQELVLHWTRKSSFSASEIAFSESIQIRKQYLGDGDLATLRALYRFSVICTDYQEFEVAKPLIKECWDGCAANLNRQGAGPLLTLMAYLARTSMFAGDYKSATYMATHCVEACGKHLSEADARPLTLLCGRTLGEIYSRWSPDPRAEATLSKSLADHEKLLGNNHPRTLQVRLELAAVLSTKEKPDLVEPLLVRVMDARKQRLGDRHPDTANALHALATFYNKQHRPEAGELFERSMEVFEITYGSANEEYLSSVFDAANFYLKNDASKSEMLFLKYIAGKPVLLNSADPRSLTAISRLAEIRLEDGRLSDAVALLSECCGAGIGNLHQSNLPANMEQRISVMQLLGEAYTAQGSWLDAESAYEKAWEAAKNTLGESVQLSLVLLECLARTNAKLKKHEAADVLYTELLQLQQAHKGPLDQSVVALKMELADSYAKRSKFVLAKQLLLEVWEARKQQGDFDVSHPDTLRTAYELGQVLAALGDFQAAETYLETCFEGRKDLVGPRHGDTLRAQLSLGSVLLSLDRTEDAQILLRDCFDQSLQAHGASHQETLRCMYLLATALSTLQLCEEAESLHEECLRLRQHELGGDAPDTLASLHTIGVLYANFRPRPALSINTLTQCLERRENVLGPRHSDTLCTMHELAGVYSRQDSFNVEVAITLYERCLEGRRVVLGAYNETTLCTMRKLAALYDFVGKLNLARELYAECLECQRKTPCILAAELLSLIHSLAVLYERLGQPQQAKPLFVECLEGRREVLGATHVDTLDTMHRLGALCASNDPQAESLLAECLEGRLSALGPSDERTLQTMSTLASLHESQAEFDKAETLYAECLRTRNEVLGTEHPATLQSMESLIRFVRMSGKWKTGGSREFREEAEDEADQDNRGNGEGRFRRTIRNLALVYANQGQFTKAEPLFLQSLEQNRRDLGESHEETLRSMQRLAVTYEKLNKNDMAESLYATRLQKLQDKYGPSLDHSDVFGAVENLADHYQAQGKLSLAEPMHRQCWEYRKATLGEKHTDTLVSMFKLTRTYSGLGRVRQAETMSVRFLAHCKKNGR
eukprot:Rmarinus@m.20934